MINNSQGKFKIAIFSNFISIIHKPLISSIILLSIIIKISYCPIAKVASSSFCDHFVKLGIFPKILQIDDQENFSANVSEAQYVKVRQSLQVAAPQLWPAPKQGI